MAVDSVSAIALWVRSHIQRDWRALTALALSVAVFGGLAMTAGIGALRAGSAWEELLARTNVPDFAKEVPSGESQAVVDELLSRSGVASATRMAFMLIGLEGSPPTGGFTGLDAGFGTDIYRPIVVSGRAADPARVDEFTINPVMAHLTGLRPGDHTVLVSTPDLVHQPATMVGIVVGPLDIGLNGGQPSAWLTPAFGSRWFEAYLAANPPQVRDTYRDLVMVNVTSQAVHAQLSAENYLAGSDSAGHEIAAALDAVGTVYLILAITTAVGLLIAVGQLTGRRVRRQSEQAVTLAALGLTPGDRRLALAGSHVFAAFLGTLLAPAVAYLASPLTGRGLISQVDPNGYHVTDLFILSLGALTGFVVLSATALGAAWGTHTTSSTASRPTPLASVALPGPAGLFGSKVAAGWTTRSGRSAARAQVGVLTLGIAAAVAVLVWSSAARHVVSAPELYGANWDAAVVVNDDGSDVDLVVAANTARDRIASRPDIGSVLGTGIAGMVETQVGRAEVLQIDKNAGPWWPTLLAGRVPNDPHEITVGGAALVGQLHIDSTVTIDDQQYTIVGEHVTTTWSNGEFGQTVAMYTGTIQDARVGAPTAVVWTELAGDATTDDLAALVGDAYAVTSPQQVRPSDVTNLELIGGLDELLLLTCALLAAATLANGIILATRARRRDHATIRALGARPSTIAGSVRWHVAIVSTVSAAVGIPLGLLAGASVWRRTAHTVYVDDVLRRPAGVAISVLAALLLTSALVAAANGVSATRRSRAQVTPE